MSELVKIDNITKEQLASICDHTFLNRPEAYKVVAKCGENPMELRLKDFNNFLKETVDMQTSPYAICVRPEDVAYSRNFLNMAGKHNIRIASVVGFPDGSAYTTRFKQYETMLALHYGAKEIDMVINKKYIDTKHGTAFSDIKTIVDLAHDMDALVKVILEVSELTPQQIKDSCDICNEAGADFVKTSTGYSASGATVDSLLIMRNSFPRGVKMSGGINPNNVKQFLMAASGRSDGMIDLDPNYVRIGESKLLTGKPGSY